MADEIVIAMIKHSNFRVRYFQTNPFHWLCRDKTYQAMQNMHELHWLTIVAHKFFVKHETKLYYILPYHA